MADDDVARLVELVYAAGYSDGWADAADAVHVSVPSRGSGPPVLDADQVDRWLDAYRLLGSLTVGHG
jgi:hypothetical protein